MKRKNPISNTDSDTGMKVENSPGKVRLLVGNRQENQAEGGVGTRQNPETSRKLTRPASYIATGLVF